MYISRPKCTEASKVTGRLGPGRRAAKTRRRRAAMRGRRRAAKTPALAPAPTGGQATATAAGNFSAIRFWVTFGVQRSS
jgi:hypothetical protein